MKTPNTCHDDYSLHVLAHEKLNIPFDQSILLSVFRLVPWKRADLIISALPELPDDVHYYILGDGESKKGWEELAEKLNVSSRVHFVGKVDRKDIEAWYRVADLFVLPSDYEGFPNVVCECVHFGLPVFVSKKGGNPETQEVFGKHMITVVDKWIEALKGDWPSCWSMMERIKQKI